MQQLEALIARRRQHLDRHRAGQTMPSPTWTEWNQSCPTGAGEAAPNAREGDDPDRSGDGTARGDRERGLPGDTRRPS